MIPHFIKAFCFLLILCSCKEQQTDKELVILAMPSSKYGCAPKISDIDWYKKDVKAPLFSDLGDHHYKITTQKEEVQRYFDQGLIFSYGFNHAEAARSFFYATQLDSSCAMAYWGYAYVLGPNYNAGMEDDHYERAYKAIQTALNLSENSTEKEKGLIDAMASRYEAKPPKDRAYLDSIYCGKMKELHHRFPEDTEIATLYGESMMNLHKWDLNTKNGEEKKWTPEIVNIFEEILEIYPQHPGANHFYIHAVEASNTPERGYKSSDFFDEGNYQNLGHLLHMPSHIYIRTGDYHKGTVSNINAVKADSTYTTLCHAQGVYPLSYYPHNYHFMAATAALEGNKKWAMFAANKVSQLVHPDLMNDPNWGTLQHYYVIPYYSMVKFGMWDEILSHEEPSDLDYPQTMRHYARGMAFLSKDNIAGAKHELKQLKNFSNDDKMKAITIWDINSVGDLLKIADKVLESEILAQGLNFEASINLLKEAIATEDGLNYNEPPDWFFSVRHNLGDIQIKAEHYEDAIVTYNEDLKKYPKNGWALHGLKLAYERLKEQEKANEIGKLTSEIWATADVVLDGSKIKL